MKRADAIDEAVRRVMKECQITIKALAGDDAHLFIPLAIAQDVVSAIKQEFGEIMAQHDTVPILQDQ